MRPLLASTAKQARSHEDDSPAAANCCHAHFAPQTRDLFFFTVPAFCPDTAPDQAGHRVLSFSLALVPAVIRGKDQKTPVRPPAPPHTLLLSHANLVLAVSYADVAAKGSRQSAQEAAAPQPPQVIPTESASTSSLVDVDTPSVRTVPPDFLDQPVKTETQAHRLERESAAAAKAGAAKKDAAAKARKSDSWLAARCASLSDDSARLLSVANLAAVIGLSSYLGYKAWYLYEKGRLDWKTAGLGLGILAAFGTAHSLVGSYLSRGRKGS